jgi:hypothetical protein
MSSLGQQEILLFGGLTGPAGSPCTDDTWHWKDDSWTLLEQQQQQQQGSDDAARPRVRMYAASAVLGGKLFLFGGWDPGAPGSGGEFLDDIWAFDPVASKWQLLDIRLPYPVSRHAACTVSAAGEESGSIIIHTYKGILVFKDGTVGATLVEKQTTGDDVPDGLSMCAMSPLGTTTNSILLFGGSTKTQQLSQDSYVLDCKKWVWTKLSCDSENNVPPPLASACAAPLDDDQQVLLFGGASIGPTGYEGGMGLIPQDGTWHLTVKGNEAIWEAIKTTTKPEGRLAASLCPIGPTSFLLQGGYDPLEKKTFGEPWILKSD